MSKHCVPLLLWLIFTGLSIAVTGCGGTRQTGALVVATPKLPPVNPDALREFDGALRALKIGGPEADEKAMQRLNAALTIDAKLWEAWHNLGAIALRGDDGESAVAAFGKALKINPAHKPALSGRAEAYRLVGNTDLAIADYRRLIRMDQTNPMPYTRAASLLRSTEAYGDALDILRDGLRMVEATGPLSVEFGLIYLAQGKDDLAKLVLSKSLHLNQKEPQVYNALALVAMAQGDDQQAFAYFDTAVELDPKYMDARYNKASILLDAGDYLGAKSELQAVVDIDSEDLFAQVALGIALRGMGKHPQARKKWEYVVKTAPKKSRVRSDALFNLAILEMDFVMDDAKALLALDRYLQSSSASHAKYKEAMELKQELGE